MRFILFSLVMLLVVFYETTASPYPDHEGEAASHDGHVHGHVSHPKNESHSSGSHEHSSPAPTVAADSPPSA